VGHEVGNLTDDTYHGGPDEKLLRDCVEAVRLPGSVIASSQETPASASIGLQRFVG
jgi:hypothetical protein